MTFNLKNYLTQHQTNLETALLEALPVRQVPQKIHQAMRYSLSAGGKRLRPILVFAGAEVCGATAQAVMPAAIALEMIHTFSLVHDDLPAMDDDSLRRGLPTNHKVFGEATAVLAGDGLLAQAFAVLATLTQYPVISTRIPEVIGDIAVATGALGMVGGQQMDMSSEGKKLSLMQLKKLHSLKTGALISVSVTSGAKLAGASRQQIAKLQKYGNAIGLAFQIADDILDIEGDVSIGKDLGSDIAKGKSTYPALLGLAGAKKIAKETVDEALVAVDSFGAAADPLRALAQYTIERKK